MHFHHYPTNIQKIWSLFFFRCCILIKRKGLQSSLFCWSQLYTNYCRSSSNRNWAKSKIRKKTWLKTKKKKSRRRRYKLLTKRNKWKYKPKRKRKTSGRKWEDRWEKTSRKKYFKIYLEGWKIKIAWKWKLIAVGSIKKGSSEEKSSKSLFKGYISDPQSSIINKINSFKRVKEVRANEALEEQKGRLKERHNNRDVCSRDETKTLNTKSWNKP